MKKLFINFLLIVSITSLVSAKGRGLSQAEIREAMANSVLEMPSPGALVNALSYTLGNIKWGKFVTAINTRKKKSLEDNVLNLGARGADAYFLTESKETAKLIAVSVGINRLLNIIKLDNKSLNNKARKAKLRKLKKWISKGKWKGVQKEINILQNSINDDFRKSNSKHLALLNNIGGWIEGYRLAVEGFNQKYKAERTEILFQKELIDYLIRDLKKSKKLKSYHLTPFLLKSLKEITNVLKQSRNYQLSKKQIKDLLKNLSKIKQYI